MTVVGSFQVNQTGSEPSTLAVQKNSQNALKGLIWQTGGNVLSFGALGLTALTTAVVGAAALSSVGLVGSRSYDNSFLSTGVESLVRLAAAAVIVDYVAVKFTGYCYSNAIHHLGPQYTIKKL